MSRHVNGTTIAAVERAIINRALEHPGLLSRKDLAFIEDIKDWPARWKLSPGQASYLYDIGEKKLDMVFNRPDRPAPAADLKARACA